MPDESLRGFQVLQLAHGPCVLGQIAHLIVVGDQHVEPVSIVCPSGFGGCDCLDFRLVVRVRGECPFHLTFFSLRCCRLDVATCSGEKGKDQQQRD